MNQTAWNDIIDKFNNCKPVYLIKEYNGMVFQIYPGWPTCYTAKKKDSRDYSVKYNTDQVLETMKDAVEFTKEEHLKYQA